jgi:Protein of unknown function (DUF433)
MSDAPRVITDPRIMMGKPVIEGTRITVELILTRLAEGTALLRRAFPSSHRMARVGDKEGM